MSDRFDQLTDEEIIEKAHKNDDEAMDYLLNKYISLVKRTTRTMYIIGADSEDLVQEGMIGLFKAVRDYNEEKGSSFFGFAKLCIERQMYSAVTAAKRKKHAPLNLYISIYSEDKDDDISSGLSDVLEAGSDFNPEDRIIEKEKVIAINKAIKDRLSSFEKKVLTLYLEGLSYAEIAMKLDKTSKSIDNAVQRIRGKLSQAEVN